MGPQPKLPMGQTSTMPRAVQAKTANLGDTWLEGVRKRVTYAEAEKEELEL